jgi:hypothetical protein
MTNAQGGNRTVSTFARTCRDCEQIQRNQRKNADRAKALLNRRATDHARRAGKSKAFFWVNMNYASLVPMLRAMMSDEGLCTSCGHTFLNERDIHIEHIEPPRHRQDWARRHARNLRLLCASCNDTKGPKPFAIWLDEQESARLSNEAHPTRRPLGTLTTDDANDQGLLF